MIIGVIIPHSALLAGAGSFILYWPLPSSATVTAGYDDGRNHAAIDIGADKGDQVIAAAPGYVTSVYSGCTHNFGKNYNCCYSLGNHVMIKHTGTIGGQGYSTRYGHLTDVYVKPGDYVKAGQVIGTAGSTGYSTGNHLDFKFYIGDNVSDPGPYLQIPQNIHYSGSDQANNAKYVQSLKSYNNTTYGGSSSDYISPNTPSGNGSASGTVITSGSLYIKDATYPALIKRGATDAKVTGVIMSDSNITSVTVQIINSSRKVMSQVIKVPNSTSFDLATISDNLKFSSLPEDDYTYEVFASNASAEIRLLSQSFIVTARQGIIIVENTLPNSLKIGQSFTVKGEIISVNPLSNVTAAVLDSSGKAVISRSVAPNTNKYNLAAIDADLKFNNLKEGVYTYKITAKDSSGTTAVLVEKQFYVSNRTLITGTVSISGLGWRGSSSAVISAPYTYATLTAEALLDQQNAPLKYQWYANGIAINGATGKTYSVTSDMTGKALSVSVTATGNTYFGTIQSRQTQAVRDKNSIIGDIATDITGRPTEYIINLGDLTISPALADTPCNELLEKILFSSTFNGVYDKNNKLKEGTDSLCTGDYVKSSLGQITFSRYYVVVLGDVNGDGKVTTVDSRMVLRHVLKLEQLNTAWAKSAADVNFTDGITSQDARTILRAALKLDKLSAK